MAAQIDEDWTKIGKNGKPLAFPPMAAAAFKKHGRGSSKPVSGRSEFPTMAADAFGRRESKQSLAPRASFDPVAAAAFGNKQRHSDVVPRGHVEFDEAASSAFGSKPRRGGGAEFDEAAASAFGGRSGRREDFPSAFGKKRTGFAEAGELGFDDAEGGEWKQSAFSRKRAEAAKPPEPKKQTFDEMFPTLVSRPTAPVAKEPVKNSFASLVRARAEQDMAEEAAKEEQKRIEEEQKRRDEYERSLHRSIHRRRVVTDESSRVKVANIGIGVATYDEEENDTTYEIRDLDRDAYGVYRREALEPEREESSSSSSEDEFEDEDEEEYWRR